MVGLSQRLIALVLLPFFTQWLTADEYGKIGFLAALFSLATYVFPLGLEAIVMRGWFIPPSRAERLNYASELQALLLVGPALLIIPLTAVIQLSGAAPGIGTGSILATLGGAAVFVAATVVPYTVLRAERRARTYLFLGVVYTLVQVISRVTLVAVAGKGVAGWVAADVISSAVLLAIAPRAAGISLRIGKLTSRARSALRSGIPLVPHGLAGWGLAFSDRLILVHAVSLSALGTYTLGYQVNTVLIACFSEFNRAVSPEYAALCSSEAAQAPRIRRMIAAQIGTVLAVGLAAGLAAPPAIRLLMPSSYGGAAEIAPWAALGAVFFGLYHVPMNHLTLVRGQTGRIWMATVVATAVSVLLNLLTVWEFGITAAAINTAISYGVLLLLVRWYEGRATGVRLRPDSASLRCHAKALVGTLTGSALAFALLSGVAELLAVTLVAAVGVARALVLYHRTEHEVSPASA